MPAPCSDRHGILTAGNLIVDHVKLIDAWPSQDALVSILEQESSNGGGPYNVAKDLALLFADQDASPFPIAVAGMIGDDADGAWIKADLETHGILDHRLLTVSQEQPTSYTDVMTVASSGRRTFFHQRGANAAFRDLPISFGSLNHRVFYLGYLLLLDALDELDPESGETGAAALLRSAREAGIATVVDLVSEESDRFQRVISPSLPHTDVLLTNEFEAGRLSGIDLSDFNRHSAGAAARAIRDLGVNQYVVIHAPGGSIALNCRDGTEYASGSVRLPDSEIRGAVGAGDAFAAGFLLGFYQEQAIDASLQQAACVAASCLRHPTTSSGILPLDACLKLGRDWGYRDF